MALESDVTRENFEEYFGDAKEVKKFINSCIECGAHLVHAHTADYNAMFIQEASFCPSCGSKKSKKIHSIN